MDPVEDKVSGDMAARFRQALMDWAEENLRDFPWRREDATPYEILVAEMFLNVTRSDVVEKVYPDFLQRFPDPEALQDADRHDVVDAIRPLGMYNRRADALLDIAETLAERGVPEDETRLRELPRVGPYVADAVLSMAFGQYRPMLDRNSARVYSRLFGEDFSIDAPREPERDFAARMIPEGDARKYNLALLDFAATVCRATNPRCEECFASSYCEYYQQETTDD